MALDRWIALVILMICLVYGYEAFFGMDDSLPPFMRRNPVWPSTFPKVLAVATILTALAILLKFEKSSPEPSEHEIDYRRLTDYNLGQAIGLLTLMVAYALLLRPLGFLLATAGFLAIGSAIMGERKFHVMIIVSAVAAGSIWYLVQEVLGVFLRPWPFIMGI